MLSQLWINVADKNQKGLDKGTMFPHTGQNEQRMTHMQEDKWTKRVFVIDGRHVILQCDYFSDQFTFFLLGCYHNMNWILISMDWS